jgi:hypothetical protein
LTTGGDLEQATGGTGTTGTTEGTGTTGTTEGTGTATERDYAPAVYGSLLVTTLVAVQWQGDPAPGRIALSLIISVAVFWLAHAWAEIVDRRVHGPISGRAVAAIAIGEASMLSSALVPALILGLPVVTSLDADTAIGIALAASLIQLFLWGLTVGRAAHASWPLALGVALVDLGLGVLIVALKILVVH